LVALSVLSHDPTGSAVYPPRAGSANLLGPPGAALAESLWGALGIAVHVLLASWFVLVVLLFLRRRVLTWAVRLIGWLVLVPCSAAAAQLLAPNAESSPLAGPGGTLGAWLTAWGEQTLSRAGMIALLCGCAALGLLLAGNFILWRFTRILGR